MDFDACISIGGRSLLDGVVRLLGPGLRALEGPLPLDVAGAPGAVLRIRSATPRLVRGGLQLSVAAELVGTVPLPVEVRAGELSLSLDGLRMRFEAIAGGDPTAGLRFSGPPAPISLPERSVDLSDATVAGQRVTLDRTSGTLPLATGDVPFELPARDVDLSPSRVAGQRVTLGASDAVAGRGLDLSGVDGAVDLSDVEGILEGVDLPDSVGVPLPALLPVSFGVFSLPLTIELPLAVDEVLGASTAFGAVFRIVDPEVRLATAFRTSRLARLLQRRLESFLAGLALPDLPTDLDLDPVVEQISEAIQESVVGAVDRVVSALVARTGRLIYPATTGLRCEASLAPTGARARIITGVGGLPTVQLGFRQAPIPDEPLWPVFRPSGPAEVQVDIDNAHVLRLLCCLLRSAPTLSMPGMPTVTDGGTSQCCQFNGVTLNLWPLLLRGSLNLCINGAPGAPKTITLRGAFRFGNPRIDGRIGVLAVDLRFTATLRVDVSPEAALTGLRLTPPNVTFESTLVELDDDTQALLVGIASSGSFFGIPVPRPVRGITVATAIESVERFLQNSVSLAVQTVLDPLRTSTSAVAIPSGVFEAFGDLVPSALTIDDLQAHGVLQTPTAPWILGPLPPLPNVFTEVPDDLIPPPVDRPGTTIVVVIPGTPPPIPGDEGGGMGTVAPMGDALGGRSDVLLLVSGDRALAAEIGRRGYSNVRVAGPAVGVRALLEVADIAVVGVSPNDQGLPRSARRGIPTLALGPDALASDAAKALDASGAGRVVATPEELAARLVAWLDDPSALAAVRTCAESQKRPASPKQDPTEQDSPTQEPPEEDDGPEKMS